MQNFLPFARFTQLLKMVDQLPVPLNIYNRHRMEYDYILGQIALSTPRGKVLTVGLLTNCSMLGSQPTANKRIQELIQFGLIKATLNDDRRIKILSLTESGISYMDTCSKLMNDIVFESKFSSDAC